MTLMNISFLLPQKAKLFGTRKTLWVLLGRKNLGKGVNE